MWTPAAALPDSQAGTAYYYRVVPCSYLKCEALTHAEHSFDKLSRKVVLKPAQYTPVDGTAPVDVPDVAGDAAVPPTCQNDVTLSWEDFRTTEKRADVANPLQTSGPHRGPQLHRPDRTDPSFQTMIETIEVDQTTFTSYVTTYPEGPVYWRVRAVDGSGNKLDWSDTGVFDKKSPAARPAAPDDGPQAVRGDLFFSWTSLPFAAQYRVEVYKNHDTAANAVNLAFPGRDRPVADGVADRAAAAAAADAQRRRPVRLAGPAHRRGRPHRRLERLGAASGSSRPRATLDLSPRQRLGRALRRAVHLVGRARRGELPLRAAARRHAHHRRADHHAGDCPGRRSWPSPAGTGSGGSPRIDASGNRPDASNWRPFTVEDTVVADHRGGDQWLRPGRHAAHDHHPAVVELRRRGHHDLPVAPGRRRDRRRDRHHLHADRADLAKNITVRATGTRPGYITGTSTSNTIVGISGDAPVAVTGVSISGTGKVGTSLTGNPAGLGQRRRHDHLPVAARRR